MMLCLAYTDCNMGINGYLDIKVEVQLFPITVVCYIFLCCKNSLRIILILTNKPMMQKYAHVVPDS